MKAIVVGLAMTALMAANDGTLHHESVVTQPKNSQTEAPTKKFDLSELPRALELPLVETPLQPGDKAPDFDLPDQYGKMHRLSDLRGQTVVLSFYPRDFTYSCSGEVIAFEEKQNDFQLRGTKVFSVSVQDVASKALFASSYSISYPLLADTNKTTVRDYRVMSKDGVAGRVTFIIGPDGHIQWTDQHVRAQTHATDILALINRPFSNIVLAAPLPTASRSMNDFQARGF